MSQPKLTVVEGGESEETTTPAYVADPNVGTASWQARIRRRAKQLAEQVENGYLELGELLYRIYDAPQNGDPTAGSVLSHWGYGNISDYAEKELNLHSKKAQRLIRIFYRVHVELNGFDNPDLLARFRRIGWSKARELVRVLAKENAEYWIGLAEKSNYTTVNECVIAYVRKQEQLQIERALAKEPDPIEASNTIELPETAPETAETAEGEPTKVTREKTAPRPAPVATAPVRSVEGFEDVQNDNFLDRKFVSKVFQIDASQAETVNLALKRAQDLAGTAKKSPSSLLSLICLDFLSGADWKGNDLDSKLRFLAKIERNLGLRLIVVDDSGDVQYGLGALQLVTQKALSEENAGELDG